MENILNTILHSVYWQPLLTGAWVLTLVFFITWVVAQWIKNYGVVDVVWGFSLVGLAAWLGYELLGGSTTWPPRVLLVFGLIILEYGRLGLYIAQRFFHHYPDEDSRYATCKQAWGNSASVLMLLAYVLQAALIFAMLLPVAFVATNPTHTFHWLEWLGLGIWIVGFGLETLADEQLKQFKGEANNRGLICDTGLWALSRHPNYFGQWLEWVGIATMALAQPLGWAMSYIVIVMYVFLTKVTGIQITEETMADKYGDAFQRYQAKTGAFFPQLFNNP